MGAVKEAVPVEEHAALEPPPAPAEAAPPVETAAPETPPAVEEKTPEPAKPAERFAPALLKLQEREAAVVAREQTIKQYEADLTALRDQLVAVERAQRSFRHDPASFIKSIAPDIDLADLAKTLWYEKLGQQAPPEYRATKEARAAQGSIEQLRAEFEQKISEERQRWAQEQAAAQQEQAYNQYLGSLASYAKAPPENLPLVKGYAAADPDRVQRGLLKIAQKHAQATGGEVLTPEQCAAKLEKELQGLRAALGVPAAAPQPAPTPVPAGGTLRNKHQSIQPNRALSGQLDDEAKFEAAMAAVEAARKVAQ